MKKLSLIAALAIGGLVACSTLATAQDSTNNVPKKGGKRGMPTVEQQMERMTTALDLTDAEKPKVKAVLEDSSQEDEGNHERHQPGPGRTPREDAADQG